MDAGICPSAASEAGAGFCHEHFGRCMFGDKRLTSRAGQEALEWIILTNHPTNTLPGLLKR
jgi:hypothetical protein